VALNYAHGMTMRTADLRNKAGEWVGASVESVSAAAASAADRMPEDLRGSIVYAEGKDSYPIAGFSFVLVRRNALRPRRSRAVAHFLLWGLDEGQRFAPINHYARVPDPIVAKARERIGSMTADGAPLLVAAQ
jgi:phosphate transport system substrate-binding protein